MSALVLTIRRIGRGEIVLMTSRSEPAFSLDPLSTTIRPSSPTWTVTLPPAPKMTYKF